MIPSDTGFIEAYIALVEGEGDMTMFVLHVSPDRPHIHLVRRNDVVHVLPNGLAMSGWAGRFRLTTSELRRAMAILKARDEHGAIRSEAVAELFDDVLPRELDNNVPPKTRGYGMDFYCGYVDARGQWIPGQVRYVEPETKTNAVDDDDHPGSSEDFLADMDKP